MLSSRRGIANEPIRMGGLGRCQRLLRVDAGQPDGDADLDDVAERVLGAGATLLGGVRAESNDPRDRTRRAPWRLDVHLAGLSTRPAHESKRRDCHAVGPGYPEHIWRGIFRAAARA